MEKRQKISRLLKNSYEITSVPEEITALKSFENADAIVIAQDTEAFAIDLCRTFKHHKLTRGIPVILITPVSAEPGEILGLKAGADDVIPASKSETLMKLKIDQIIHFTSNLSVSSRILRRVDQAILSNISIPSFQVKELANELGMDRKSLYRKLKNETGLTSQMYLRNFRLEEAARLIEEGDCTITEVASQVGFHDVSYFSRCFKDLFDVPPSDWTCGHVYRHIE